MYTKKIQSNMSVLDFVYFLHTRAGEIYAPGSLIYMCCMLNIYGR